MGAERKSHDPHRRGEEEHGLSRSRPRAGGGADCPNADPLHKVTIIPRGMALGVTMQLPIDDKHCYNKDYLEAQLAILMGGRIAEEIFMNHITTGAGNDIERATEMARKMVCEWGMSELGPAELRQEGRADLPRPRNRPAPRLQRRRPRSGSTSRCGSWWTRLPARPQGHRRAIRKPGARRQRRCWSAKFWTAPK